MDPNVLLHEPPRTVEVSGGSVRLRTQYRVWIQVERLIDDVTIPREELGGRILMTVFDNERRPDENSSPLVAVLTSPSEALDAALAYFNFN